MLRTHPDDPSATAAAGSGNRLLHLFEAGHLTTPRFAEERLRSPHVMRCRFCAIWAVVADASKALAAGRLDDDEGPANRVRAMMRERQYAGNEQYPIAQLFMLRREETRINEILPEVEALAARYPALVFWQAILGLSYAELGRMAEAQRILRHLGLSGFSDIPRNQLWLG